MSRNQQTGKGRKQLGGGAKTSGHEELTSEGAEISDGVYRQVGQEVLAENFDPVCWARALTECGGGREEAVAAYARLRSEELTQQVGAKVEKKKVLACRMAQAYRETNEEPQLEPISYDRPGGLVGAIDSIFWHCVALVGAVSCMMAAQVMWPELRPHLTVERVVMIVFAFQLFPVLGWVAAGRNGLFSAVSYSQAAHISACVVVAGSVVLGGYLLMGGEEHDLTFHPDEPTGSLLVVMPEEELMRPVVHWEKRAVKPVVHVEPRPTIPVRLVAAEEEG